MPLAPANDRDRNYCPLIVGNTDADTQDEPLFAERVAGLGIAEAEVEVEVESPFGCYAFSAGPQPVVRRCTRPLRGELLQYVFVGVVLVVAAALSLLSQDRSLRATPVV